MLGLEISSDWYEVHVNVIKWASADFGGGMLNCSELLVSWKLFYPPQHPPVYPRFHAPFAQGLHFNLPICCNCFESWLARHFLQTPSESDTHAYIYVCVCVCVCSLVDVSNTSSDAHERTHSIARPRKTWPTRVVEHKRCLFTKAPTLRRCHLTADLSLLNMKNTITQRHRYLSPRAPCDLSFFSQRFMIAAADLKLHERDWSKGQRDGKQK